MGTEPRRDEAGRNETMHTEDPLGTIRWHRALALFEQAASCPTADRDALLAELGRDDPELRATVQQLLDADEQVSPLDQQLIDLPTALTMGKMPEPPQTVGRYRLLRKIGEGGMGTVYLATRDDLSFERRVVVKLARASLDDENGRRLEQEGQILARLEHPAIARLYDAGTTDSGLPFFVMEYIEGLPIDRHCRQHDLGVAARLHLFRQVCAAVRDAHQNLVVHRDLKPSNILVTPDGAPKLLDFGIAKLLGPAREGNHTLPWLRQLTPSYASPEHVRQGPITTASDVYSLGVLLYELLTGQLPYRFRDTTPQAIEHAWATTDPPPPSLRVARNAGLAHWRKTLRGDLDSIVLKALEHRPESRYSTVDRLVDDLDRQRLGFPVEARTITWHYRAGKLLRRHRRAASTMGVVAVLTVGFVLTMLWQALRVAEERDRALHQERQKQAVLETFLDIFRQEDPYLEAHAQADLSVREALDRAADRRVALLDDQPEVQATVLHEIGLIYHRLGLSAPARRYLGTALALRRKQTGPDHVRVAETLSLLADAQPDDDNRLAAKALAREAVRTLRRSPGADDRHFVRPLNTLVSILCERGEHAEARPLAEEAAQRASALPSTDYRRAFAAINLAVVHGKAGDHGTAEKLYGDALRMLEKQLGPEHPALTPALINRGVARRNLDELANALADYERAWALIAPRGPEHPLALRLLNNLGRLRFALGDFHGARTEFEHAVEVLAHRGSPDSPLALRLEMRIAESRSRLGEPAEAEAMLRRLLDRWRPKLDPDDPWVHQARSILGEALRLQGRDEEAEPLLRDAVDALRDHPLPRFRREAFDRLRALLASRNDAAAIIALEAQLVF